MDCVEVQKQFLIDMRVCQSLHSWLWIPGFWLAHRLRQPESGSLLPMRSHVPEGPSCSRNYSEGQKSGTKEICHRNWIDIRNIQLWFLYTLIDRCWHWWVVPVLFGSERTTWRSKTFEWPSNCPLESREVWERVYYVLVKTVNWLEFGISLYWAIMGFMLVKLLQKPGEKSRAFGKVPASSQQYWSTMISLYSNEFRIL